MNRTAIALRLYGQPRPLQSTRIRAPRGAPTGTFVSFGRLPLKRPAILTTGNGLMKSSVVSGGGVVPAGVCVPESNVPVVLGLSGSGLTSTHVLGSVVGGIEYGLRVMTIVGSESAAASDPSE